MMDTPAYGQTRTRRAEVTYAQIERAATDILKTGTRPTLEGIRKALGGGSPRTILDGLNRFWAALGGRISGNPDTLRRLPASVADLAEGLWHQALTLATDAVQSATTESQSQLARLKSQLEQRTHTLSQREIELDSLIRARERTVKELEGHLRVALSIVSHRDATISALESRLTNSRNEVKDYMQRLKRFVQRTAVREKVGSLASLRANVKKPHKSRRVLLALSPSRSIPRSRSGRRKSMSKGPRARK